MRHSQSEVEKRCGVGLDLSPFEFLCSGVRPLTMARMVERASATLHRLFDVGNLTTIEQVHLKHIVVRTLREAHAELEMTKRGEDVLDGVGARLFLETAVRWVAELYQSEGLSLELIRYDTTGVFSDEFKAQLRLIRDFSQLSTREEDT